MDKEKKKQYADMGTPKGRKKRAAGEKKKSI